ncbi:MAG: hypothetical protein ACKV1O_06255 [Saprospiraceae bacterium]
MQERQSGIIFYWLAGVAMARIINLINLLTLLNLLYFPHKNNTLLAFEYREGGFVKVHSALTNPAQKARADSMLSLVGIDKYPGNPKYPASNQHPQGFPVNDKRWEHRRAAWEKAVLKLPAYEAGEISAQDVANFAFERGFFSVWFSVFSAHEGVKAALISKFRGTATSCFDSDFNPIPRNPGNTADPI